jgi:excisionase family DNA binding protein
MTTPQRAAIERVAPHADALPGGLREAGRRLGIGERRCYRLAHQGKLPFVIRLGGRFVVPRLAFERFLQGQLRPDQPADRQAAPR